MDRLSLDRYFGDPQLANGIEDADGFAKLRFRVPVDKYARIGSACQKPFKLQFQLRGISRLFVKKHLPCGVDGDGRGIGVLFLGRTGCGCSLKKGPEALGRLAGGGNHRG